MLLRDSIILINNSRKMATKEKNIQSAKGKKRKASIHPDFGEIEVELTDGTKIKMRSTLARKQKKLKLDTCPKIHRAWKREGDDLNADNSRLKRVKAFEEKFKGLKI